MKQLGLAHYVFPGADYSRFSHSVGACHVMQRSLGSLLQRGVIKLEAEQVRKYRLVALLHDVGHYPFSHAMEHALGAYYGASVVEPKPGEKGAGGDELYANHETVTGLVLKEDPQISSIVRAAGIAPEEVEATIRRHKPGEYLANLISSDLDADRIDYLLRTAHHAGLPYGSVDLEYLLTQLCVDGDGRVCLSPKAARAAEHMLLCRYFDYQQVVFNKSVAGFEWILKDCINDLVRSGKLPAAKKDIREHIGQGTWSEFDDAYVLNLLRRRYRGNTHDPNERLRLQALLERVPPSMLHADEEVLPRSELLKMDRVRSYEFAANEIAKKFSLPRERVHVWRPTPMTLTKVGGKTDIGAIKEDDPKKRDKVEQAVRILNDDGTSTELQVIDKSLMRVLSEQGVRPLRLYALLTQEEKARLAEMKEEARRLLSHDS